MSRFNPEDNRFPQGFRSFSRHDDFDDRMYDDRSRSRSADRRRSPPGGTRSSLYDKDRARSPRGPAFSRRREYSRDRDSRQRLKSRDRDDFRRWSSRSPPPPRRGRPMYRDRDREDYRSPPHDDRSRSFSRSRSPRRGRYFGQESREVMMDGLPVDMVEEDISNELRDEYFVEGLEEVRVIRDRQTKKSRQLGFLQFRTVSDSRAFLEPNFPSIYFYGPNASGNDRRTRVRIAYSREREDRNRSKAEGDWICRMCAIVNYATRQKCFRCQAPRPESGPIGPPGVPAPKVDNNGDNDAAPENQPSQFLLIRGLESSVTEELLAKGIAKLYRPAPSNNADGLAANQKKVAKVASTTGDSNLGARDGSIRRVLLVRDRKSNESWHYGFAEFATAQDAQAAMARLNSFEKFTISSRPVLVTYIHAGVFVPVMNPTASTVRFTFSPLNNPHLKLMYWDEDAYVTELTVSSAEVDSNQSQSKQSASEIQAKNAKESEKRKRKADTAGSSGAKKLAMPTHLQFWSNRHAELHGIHKKKDEDDKNVADASSNIGSDRGSSPAELSAPPSQSYADLNRNCCYLCMRQFKSSVEVNRHERLSQLHRDNMQKEELKARAMDKLVKHGVIQQNAPEYRDRARERRQAFGSSKKPSGKAKTTAAPPKENEPAQTASKGASLLSKMGWSEGTGLGAHGTGVTAPIATEVYAQGVGLGAQGSKLGDASEEAARNTRNRYDDFLEKTKRTARERYEQMG